MLILEVGLKKRSYPIIIESGCLQRVGQDLVKRNIGKRYGVITDDQVAKLYGDQIMTSLNQAGLAAELLVFPHGEANKSLQTIGDLAGRLAQLGFDRQDALIGFGGGVTGDLAGFLASSYMRGIPFIQIPTTLLAQVDSSVGGKTGVDIPEGKNLVGAFYQPKVVYIDIALLKTLPTSELLGGFAEVIKYGIICDAQFLQFLKENRRQLLDLQDDLIEQTVHKCCSIKAEVVAADEREGGRRRILNFGHTIGHAVEGASKYTLIHGLAVAIGMAAAARLAVLTGHLENDHYSQIIELLNAYGMPVDIPAGLDRKVIKKYLLTDKKVVGGKVHYVLPTEIGKTCIVNDIAESLVEQVLREGTR